MILENESLLLEIDPSHGGRIIRFFDKHHQEEQLWFDAARLPVNPALDYDGNFAGGMDELLPNDPPENGFPDHGELWMTPLTCEKKDDSVILSGLLPVSRLSYRRTMRLDEASMIASYQITNTGNKPLDFLWKLHAALRIETGDQLFAPVGCVQAADPGDWSKAGDGMPRQWNEPYTIGAMDGTSDFFFLTDLKQGRLTLKRKSGTEFHCEFSTGIFPNSWVFASFGRLNGSRTLIMEPCTNYPLTIADAKRCRVCAHLGPGESMRTEVRWYVEA